MLNGLPTVWSVYTDGEHFDADVLFLNYGCIAMGWEQTGDLRLLPPTREAYRRCLIERYKPYGNTTEDRLKVISGALYKLAIEIKIGDLVVYRSTYDEQIFIGEVTGAYEYDASPAPEHHDARHRRAVAWYQPRVYFSDIAQKAASVRQPFRQVADKSTVQEFVKALKKARADEAPVQGVGSRG